MAADEMYFRSTQVVDAPDGPDGWLSDHVFVATLARVGNEVQVRVFVLR
jgi:hypothetical protein